MPNESSKPNPSRRDESEADAPRAVDTAAPPEARRPTPRAYIAALRDALPPASLAALVAERVHQGDAWAAELAARYLLGPAPTAAAPSLMDLAIAEQEGRTEVDDVNNATRQHILSEMEDEYGARAAETDEAEELEILRRLREFETKERLTAAGLS